MPDTKSPVAPSDDAAPEQPDTGVDAPVAEIEADLLVEDVSIDGMCGVY